jgi:DNA-binding XRE family transcriptional regulator
MVDRKEIVAINIRRLCRDKGWTQKDLADRVGLSARYVGQIEAGVDDDQCAGAYRGCTKGWTHRTRQVPRGKQ